MIRFRSRRPPIGTLGRVIADASMPTGNTYELPCAGPIIGHTTARGTNVWVQGAYKRERKQYAIVALVSLDDESVVMDAVCVALPHATEYACVVRIGAHEAADAAPDASTYFCNRYQHTHHATLPLEPVTDYKIACTVIACDDAHCLEEDAVTLFHAAPRRTVRYGTFRTFGTPQDDQLPLQRGVGLTQVAHIRRGWITYLMDTVHSVVRNAFEYASALRTDGLVEEHDQWLADLEVPPIDAQHVGLVFFAGSCHYPKRREVSDLIFGTLHRHVQHVLQTCTDVSPFVLMMGDQVYADALTRFVPVGLADTAREFRKLYQKKYAGRHMQRLLASVPTYMCMDDHEIEDGWSRDRLTGDEASVALQTDGLALPWRWSNPRALFNTAIQAYTTYQASFGPCGFMPPRLWYTFENGAYPFFVLDTRTKRSYKHHVLLDTAQLDALKAWVCKYDANIPKFIVASSVIAPGKVHDRTKHGWHAFERTRDALLEHFARHHVRNVVFVQGDLHCSLACTMEMRYHNNNRTAVYHSIVSSPLYWPYPMADGDLEDLVCDSKLAQSKDTWNGVYKPLEAPPNRYTLDYRVVPGSYTQGNNFARIAVEEDEHSAPKAIHVQWFGMDGRCLSQCTLPLHL